MVLVASHDNITKQNALGPRLEHSAEIKSVLSFTAYGLIPAYLDHFSFC